eukprot:Rmarinus@m.16259
MESRRPHRGARGHFDRGSTSTPSEASTSSKQVAPAQHRRGPGRASLEGGSRPRPITAEGYPYRPPPRHHNHTSTPARAMRSIGSFPFTSERCIDEIMGGRLRGLSPFAVNDNRPLTSPVGGKPDPRRGVNSRSGPRYDPSGGSGGGLDGTGSPAGDLVAHPGMWDIWDDSEGEWDSAKDLPSSIPDSNASDVVSRGHTPNIPRPASRADPAHASSSLWPTTSLSFDRDVHSSSSKRGGTFHKRKSRRGGGPEFVSRTGGKSLQLELSLEDMYKAGHTTRNKLPKGHPDLNLERALTKKKNKRMAAAGERRRQPLYAPPSKEDVSRIRSLPPPDIRARTKTAAPVRVPPVKAMAQPKLRRVKKPSLRRWHAEYGWPEER